MDNRLNTPGAWTPFTIVALYALLGALWILFSDSLLAAFVSDPPAISRLQTYKGWLFVVATALLLHRLIAAMSARQKQVEKRLSEDIAAHAKTRQALLESEQRFRAIAMSTPDHIVVLDKELRYRWVLNPQLGLTEQEMIGRTEVEILAKEDAAKLTRLQAKVLESGKPEFVSIPLVSLTGEVQHFEGVYVPRHNPEGNIDGLIGYLRNVTDRVSAEQALRQSEASLAEAQRIAHVGSWLFDKAGHVSWSDEVYRIFGVAPDAFSPDARSFLGLIHPDDRPSVQKWIDACLAGEKPGELEFRSILPDGALRWISGRGEPRHAPGHGSMFMTGTVLDITGRKQAQEQLRVTNEELRAINRIISTTTSMLGVQAILENVLGQVLEISGLEGGTICLAASDGTLHLAAQRAAVVATKAGPSADSVKIGDCLCGTCARDHKPLILVDPEAVSTFAAQGMICGDDHRFHAAFPLLAGEQCLGVLCVFTRTDKKPSRHRLKLLETASSQIALAVENAQLYEQTVRHGETLERTVRERTEALEKNQKELINLVEDLNAKGAALAAANAKLQELDRLKAMFIASMSHELRTPLNSIIGFTGIILQGLSGEISAEQRDQLKRVYRSSKHLLALINDVIDISKIEAGKIEIRLETVDLEDIIREALSSMRPEAEGKGLDLQAAPCPGLRLHTDRKRLLQCTLNLLSNAVKFTEKGRISIDTHELGQMVVIAVRDTGIGVKAEDMPKLFGSFVRLDSHLRTAVLGTGLGLYLTKKLAEEALGGSVAAESVWGRGSTFTLKIPRGKSS